MGCLLCVHVNEAAHVNLVLINEHGDDDDDDDDDEDGLTHRI